MAEFCPTEGALPENGILTAENARRTLEHIVGSSFPNGAPALTEQEKVKILRSYKTLFCREPEQYAKFMKVQLKAEREVASKKGKFDDAAIARLMAKSSFADPRDADNGYAACYSRVLLLGEPDQSSHSQYPSIRMNRGKGLAVELGLLVDSLTGLVLVVSDSEQPSKNVAYYPSTNSNPPPIFKRAVNRVYGNCDETIQAAIAREVVEEIHDYRVKHLGFPRSTGDRPPICIAPVMDQGQPTSSFRLQNVVCLADSANPIPGLPVILGYNCSACHVVFGTRNAFEHHGCTNREYSRHLCQLMLYEGKVSAMPCRSIDGALEWAEEEERSWKPVRGNAVNPTEVEVDEAPPQHFVASPVAVDWKAAVRPQDLVKLCFTSRESNDMMNIWRVLSFGLRVGFLWYNAKLKVLLESPVFRDRHKCVSDGLLHFFASDQRFHDLSTDWVSPEPTVVSKHAATCADFVYQCLKMKKFVDTPQAQPCPILPRLGEEVSEVLSQIQLLVNEVVSCDDLCIYGRFWDTQVFSKAGGDISHELLEQVAQKAEGVEAMDEIVSRIEAALVGQTGNPPFVGTLMVLVNKLAYLLLTRHSDSELPFTLDTPRDDGAVVPLFSDFVFCETLLLLSTLEEGVCVDFLNAQKRAEVVAGLLFLFRNVAPWTSVTASIVESLGEPNRADARSEREYRQYVHKWAVSLHGELEVCQPVCEEICEAGIAKTFLKEFWEPCQLDLVSSAGFSYAAGVAVPAELLVVLLRTSGFLAVEVYDIRSVRQRCIAEVHRLLYTSEKGCLGVFHMDRIRETFMAGGWDYFTDSREPYSESFLRSREKRMVSEIERECTFIESLFVAQKACLVQYVRPYMQAYGAVPPPDELLKFDLRRYLPTALRVSYLVILLLSIDNPGVSIETITAYVLDGVASTRRRGVFFNSERGTIEFLGEEDEDGSGAGKCEFFTDESSVEYCLLCLGPIREVMQKLTLVRGDCFLVENTTKELGTKLMEVCQTHMSYAEFRSVQLSLLHCLCNAPVCEDVTVAGSIHIEPHELEHADFEQIPKSVKDLINQLRGLRLDRTEVLRKSFSSECASIHESFCLREVNGGEDTDADREHSRRISQRSYNACLARHLIWTSLLNYSMARVPNFLRTTFVSTEGRARVLARMLGSEHNFCMNFATLHANLGQTFVQSCRKLVSSTFTLERREGWEPQFFKMFRTPEELARGDPFELPVYRSSRGYEWTGQRKRRRGYY